MRNMVLAIGAEASGRLCVRNRDYSSSVAVLKITHRVSTQEVWCSRVENVLDLSVCRARSGSRKVAEFARFLSSDIVFQILVIRPELVERTGALHL